MSVQMPVVDTETDFTHIMTQARSISAGQIALPSGETGQRCVSLITPGRMVIPVPCPPPGVVPEEMTRDIKNMVGSDEPLNIVIIAYTDVVDALAKGDTDLGNFIPFMGYLLGMAYCGHTVIIFEGHASALEAGCRGADLLIVDETMAGFLQKDWPDVAFGVMTTKQILVFCQDGNIMMVQPPEA